MNPSFVYNFVHLRPSEMIDLHEQDTWELSCVLVGAGTRIIGDKSEAFSSGDLVLIPPRTPHCWYFDDTTTDRSGHISCISLMIPVGLVEGIKSLFPELAESFSHMFSTGREYLGKTAKDIISRMRKMDAMSQEERTANLLTLLYMLAQHSDESGAIRYERKSPTLMRKIQVETYIACGLHRELALDSLARHLGMNRSSLCLFFRREFGMTFTEYVSQKRIEEAQRLLRETALPIQSICFQTGFSTISYFNRIFNRLTGCSPKVFRTRHLNR